MPPSKLDKYLNILEVLTSRPRKLDYIAYKTNMECTALKRYLNFLVSNDLAEERTGGGKRMVYAITERGVSVFKTLRALKYLEKLKNSLLVVEEARYVAPMLLKHSQKLKEK